MVGARSSSWETEAGAPAEEEGSMVVTGCLGIITFFAGATDDAPADSLDGSLFFF